MAVRERSRIQGYNFHRDHRPWGDRVEFEDDGHAVTGWPHEAPEVVVHLGATGVTSWDMPADFSGPQTQRWNVRDIGIPPAGIYDGVVDVSTGQDVDVSLLRTANRAALHSVLSKMYQLMLKYKFYVGEGGIESTIREFVNKPTSMSSWYGSEGTWPDLGVPLVGAFEEGEMLDPMGVNYIIPRYNTPIDSFRPLPTLEVVDTSRVPQSDVRGWEFLSGLHPIAKEFAEGVSGRKPQAYHVAVIDRIMKAVEEKTKRAEYSVDDDGAVSFEATLRTGQFIMCEVSLAGNINAGIYTAADGDLVEFLACPSEEDLLTWF
jgi:hypothetical protein